MPASPNTLFWKPRFGAGPGGFQAAGRVCHSTLEGVGLRMFNDFYLKSLLPQE